MTPPADAIVLPVGGYACAECLVQLGTDPGSAAFLGVLVAWSAPRILGWVASRWASRRGPPGPPEGPTPVPA